MEGEVWFQQPVGLVVELGGVEGEVWFQQPVGLGVVELDAMEGEV